MTQRTTVGSCGKAHGIRGEVAVYTDAPERFRVGMIVTTESGAELTVKAVRPHKNHLLLAFDEILDRSQADSLRNVRLSADVAGRPPLDGNEFWIADLVGREVRDTSGKVLGRITDVATSTAQDRLVIWTDSGSVEVPFVPELVPEVTEEYVVVDPPDGLLG